VVVDLAVKISGGSSGSFIRGASEDSLLSRPSVPGARSPVEREDGMGLRKGW